MKISGLTTTSGVKTSSTPTRATRTDKPAGDSGDVRLSPASAELAGSGHDSVVDTAKVREIRQAISEGRLQINAGAIADRLIATARELIDSRRKS